MENIVKSFLAMPDYDEYEMIKCLKNGDLVKVYLLYDSKCGRKLLLKCSEKEKGCLENEAEILSQIKGEGIPALFRCFDYENCIFLFREYIEGQTLKEYIDGKGKISEEQAAEIGVKLCNILSHIHSHNPPVIHRDIKAENIVITNDKRVYIIDFGTARDYSPLSSQDTHIMGTPATAPPEQFGFGQTDERSDIYSLGVLLHQLVTGEINLKKGIAPAKINKIIKRCTDFSPNARYDNAAELKKALILLQKKESSPLLKFTAVITAACIGSALVGGIAVRVFDKGFYGEKYSVGSEQSSFYKFKDQALETEVCRILGKKTGTVTLSDLSLITSIKLLGDTPMEYGGIEDLAAHGTNLQIRRNAGSEGWDAVTSRGAVASLEDISAMPNLTVLILCNQMICDLSPLKGSRVSELSLHGNEIEDISPLAECYYLHNLMISNNRIRDFLPLINCASLEVLTAGANDLESLDDIARIRNLKYLQIHDCPRLSDYSAVRGMNGLDGLSIRPVNNELFEAIGSLTELNKLWIWNMRDEADLYKLSNLQALNTLYMDGINVNSLEGMENFPKLNYLALMNIEAEDLSPLSKLDNLSTLDLRSNSINDYSAVKEIKSLKDLYVSSDCESEIRGWTNDNVNLIVY